MGDIVGEAGLNAVLLSLDEIKKKHQADLVIINGENAASGFGLLPEQAQQLFYRGVDVITTGNHIWQHEEIYPMLDQHERLLRPENYPAGAPGHGSVVLTYRNHKVAVMNLQGRVRMGSMVDCPFKTAKNMLKKLRCQTPIIFVDIHAEDTLEKQALAHFLDGKVTGIVGTHTHVQTMDETILPGGTGYIGDLGLSGSISGVIGSTVEGALVRYTTQLPQRSTPSKEDLSIQGVCMSVDPSLGKCLSIERLHYPFSLT